MTARRSDLADLGQRLAPKATWGDLALPQEVRRQLRTISERVGRAREGAGDGDHSPGFVALFSGPSGTGKTLAAEALAAAVGSDLLQVDLARLAETYIGETEKNLGRLFAAAEGAGVVLFFDEADALFGRRSEVRDSHDRYANIEVSYLLQRLETYRGLAILASNSAQALDPARLPRVAFAVDFPDCERAG